MNDYLPAGEIVNTHGVRGEMRVLPWADSPEFLLGFSAVYVDGEKYAVQSCRVQKTCVLLKLAGVDTFEQAQALRGKTVEIARADIELPEGTHFIADLIGMTVLDQRGNRIGELADVLSLPKHDVYIVRGEQEYLIPAVPEFIRKIDAEARTVSAVVIEGMASDAD